MADSLEGRKLVTEATRQAVHGRKDLTAYEKTTMLMGVVKGKLERNPDLILKVRDVFRKCGLDELVEELENRMLHDKELYIIHVVWQR